MGANWWLKESEACDPTGARFQRFCLEISDLRAEVTRMMACLARTEDGLEIMLEMLRRIKNLDHQMATWTAGLPAEYQPQTLYYELDRCSSGGSLRTAAVFPGRVDVYRDIVTAAVLNGTRAARIILGSLLIRVAAWICSPADYRLSPDYVTAVRNIRAVTADLVAAVPFMLSAFGGDGIASGSFACGADVQAKMVGGLMASWPLSTVRTCDFSTDEQREWAVGRLMAISQDLGIKYAESLANVSEPLRGWGLGSMLTCAAGQDSLPLDAHAPRRAHDDAGPSQGDQGDTRYPACASSGSLVAVDFMTWVIRFPYHSLQHRGSSFASLVSGVPIRFTTWEQRLSGERSYWARLWRAPLKALD